jgi:hypothetical protein
MKKNDMLILADTRQQKDSHIIKYFDKEKISWIRSSLESADYMAVRYDNGFVKDYSTLIDTKKDLLELCGNLCHSSEHARVVREIELGQSLGCTNFIFLIADNDIKTAEDIKLWSNKNTKVKGETLLKIMTTFKQHHNCRFIIVPKKEMGQKIIELLTNN